LTNKAVQVFDGSGQAEEASLIGWHKAPSDPAYDWFGRYKGTSVMLMQDNDDGTWAFRWNGTKTVWGLVSRDEALAAATRFVETVEAGGDYFVAKMEAVHGDME
jgi:hypothetical protein